MIAAVVLAAGASSRLGCPKQILLLDGETLLDRAIRTARDAGFAEIHVVLGANALLIQQTCELEAVVVHLNQNWEEGMASSLRLGIEAAGGADGVLVTTCDMPAVTTRHLRFLTATGETTCSSYAGRKGVPAFFASKVFSRLLELEGETGARALLREAPSIPLAGGELDIDTPEDVDRLFAQRVSWQRA